MIAAFVVGLAATATSPEFAKAEMALAMRSLERLAALPIDKPNATAREKEMRQAKKAEFETLLIYVRMIHEVVTRGNTQSVDLINLMTVAQQTAVAGKELALTPEEALCWDRAGLNLAAAARRFVALQVLAGKAKSLEFYQASAQYERFRKEYRDTLAEVVKNAR